MSYGTICWNIKPQPVFIPNNFSISTAVDLMQLCVYTYKQYDKYIANEEWTIPEPYKLKETFYSFEKVDDNFYKKVPFGFICSKQNENSRQDIYICLRGTRSAKEWEDDAKVPLVECSFLNDDTNDNTLKIKVHKGFQEVYINVNDVDKDLASIQEQIKNYLVKVDDYDNLWVTGHSLGAALAIFAVIDIVTNTIHKDAIMYNFASPLVGNQAFANYFKSKIGTNKCDKNNNNLNTCSWRVVNTNDVVPTVPPPSKLFDYVHVNGCSGPGICNNSGCSNLPVCNDNDVSKNGLFEITFAEKCTDLFNDISCFVNAHNSDTYLSTLQNIKNNKQ
jgi:triacylglycerol lipase